MSPHPVASPRIGSIDAPKTVKRFSQPIVVNFTRSVTITFYSLCQGLLFYPTDRHRNMTQTDLSGIRILVVEDSLLQRRILTRILHAANAGEVRQAADGSEALAILKTFLPDIILTNRQMQPMDGITFASRVRASEQQPFQALPIIMLSLNDELNLKQIAHSVGINAFLMKPVSPEALCQCILQLTRDPLPFVRSANYVGPDRRRADAPFSGPDRRRTGL